MTTRKGMMMMHHIETHGAWWVEETAEQWFSYTVFTK